MLDTLCDIMVFDPTNELDMAFGIVKIKYKKRLYFQNRWSVCLEKKGYDLNAGCLIYVALTFDLTDDIDLIISRGNF